jgi:hypothetical protein
MSVRLPLTAIALTLGTWCVQAQTVDPTKPTPATLTRFVPSGEPRTIGFFTALNPDCTSNGPVVIRLLVPPDNGEVALEQGEMFTSYARENVRAPCNLKRSPGATVTYKSRPEFKGEDAFRCLIMYPDGFATEMTYNVLVR